MLQADEALIEGRVCRAEYSLQYSERVQEQWSTLAVAKEEELEQVSHFATSTRKFYKFSKTL